jgi:hypothetical protein
MVSFTPRPLYSRGRDKLGGWIDCRVLLNDVVKGKFFTLPELELRPLVVEPISNAIPMSGDLR